MCMCVRACACVHMCVSEKRQTKQPNPFLGYLEVTDNPCQLCSFLRLVYLMVLLCGSPTPPPTHSTATASAHCVCVCVGVCVCVCVFCFIFAFFIIIAGFTVIVMECSATFVRYLCEFSYHQPVDLISKCGYGIYFLCVFLLLFFLCGYVRNDLSVDCTNEYETGNDRSPQSLTHEVL